MRYSEKAAEKFCEGFNCAQATAIVFSEKLNCTQKDLLRLSAGFGGGMSGRREQCGAVSAMVMIAGYMHGDYDPNDITAKKDFYNIVKGMINEFETLFGTTTCRELLSKAKIVPLSDPSVRNDEYYQKRPCVRFVRAAADIIENHLFQR